MFPYEKSRNRPQDGDPDKEKKQNQNPSGKKVHYCRDKRGKKKPKDQHPQEAKRCVAGNQSDRQRDSRAHEEHRNHLVRKQGQ
jgi:hypothetical protein